MTVAVSSCHPERHSDLLGVTPPMYFLRQVRELDRELDYIQSELLR